MATDRSTKFLLAAIAAALWMHLILPLLVPDAVADSPMRVEILGDVRVAGAVEVPRGQLNVSMGKLELDTWSNPVRVEVKQ
jgi:hypothetical protein